jgi:expansin
MRQLLACCLVFMACSAEEPSAPPATQTATTFGPIESGVATYYAATGEGNCSYDATPADLDVVALDTRQYAAGAWCGACLRVEGPKGVVKVRVVDSCPSCESRTHIDLSESAFAKIANIADGRVPVRFQFVTCAVSGPLSYRFKEGSNEWWTAIQVRNHPAPIKTLEAKVAGAWSPLTRSDYGYFIADKGLGKGPYELRVTSIDGRSLVDTGIAFGEGKVVTGASSFE